MKIVQKILTKNPCYTSGRKITVKGLMLHSVGCNQPDAMTFIRQWNPPADGREICVHGFIDGNTGDVYQCLPWNHRGWHAGGKGNDTHIGVEMCEPACIKYTKGATFTCSDVDAARAVVQRTYDSAVVLFAHLCAEFDLDPLKDGVIVSHAEGHKRGIASGHADPEHLWKQLGMGYTMDGFRNAVNAVLRGDKDKEVSTPKETQNALYRVQTGAYSVKENAEAALKKIKTAGFDAFIVRYDGLYKIQVGAFREKSNAEAMLVRIRASGYNGFIVGVGTKDTATIAREVIAGKWGNGAERKRRLTLAGYDYSAVQAVVNKLMK